MPEKTRETVADKTNRKTSEAVQNRIEEGFTRPTVRPFNLVKAKRIGGASMTKTFNIESGYSMVSDKAGFTGTAEFGVARQSRVSGTTVGIDLGYYYNEAINPYASIHPLWNFGGSAGIYSEGGAINAGYQPYVGPSLSIVSTSGIGLSFAQGFDDLVATGKFSFQTMLVPGPVSNPKILFDAATGATSSTFGGIYSVIKAGLDTLYSIGARLIEKLFPHFKRMHERRSYSDEAKAVDAGSATIEQCSLIIQSKPSSQAVSLVAACQTPSQALGEIMKSQLAKAGASEALVQEWQKKAAELTPLAFLEEARKIALPGFDISPVEQVVNAVLRQTAATLLMSRFYDDIMSGDPSLKLSHVEQLYKFVSRNSEIFAPHFLADLKSHMDDMRWSSSSRKVPDFVNKMGTKGVGGQIGAAAISSLLNIQELTLDIPLIFRDPLSVPSRLVEGLYTFEDTKKAHGFFGKAVAFLGDLLGDSLTFLTRTVMAFSPIQFRSDARKEKVRADIKAAMKENEKLLSSGTPDWSDRKLVQNTLYLNNMLQTLDTQGGRPIRAKIEKHMAKYELAYELLSSKAARLAAAGCDSKGDVNALGVHIKRLTETYLYLSMLPEGKAGKLEPEVKSELAEISALFKTIQGKYADKNRTIVSLCKSASVVLSDMQDLSSEESKIKPQLDSFFYWMIKSGGSVKEMLSSERDDKELSGAIGGAKSVLSLSTIFSVYHDYLAQSLASSTETVEEARRALAKAYEESIAMVRQLRYDIDRGIKKPEDLRERMFDVSNQLYFTSLICNSIPEIMDKKVEKLAYALGDEVDKLLDDTPLKFRKGMSSTAREKTGQKFTLAYAVIRKGVLMPDDAEKQGARFAKRTQKDEDYDWYAKNTVEHERKQLFECDADAKSFISAAKDFFKDEPEIAKSLGTAETFKQIRGAGPKGLLVNSNKYILRIVNSRVQMLECPESESAF